MTKAIRKYLVATDVGGTCTDTIVFAAGEPVRLGKALSTPPDFATGVLDSIRSAAEKMGMTLEALLSETGLFIHGSTVVDNTVLTRDGSRTGLLTTAGFEDTVLVTRGAYGRWGGLTEDRIKHPVKTERGTALIGADCIVGVRERADYKGAILQEIDEAEVERAIRLLVERQKVEAIAVSFLWSFYNPANERKVRAVIERIAPHVYCTLSSEIAPVPGEYERSSTTVINAYAGQITRSYLASLQTLLAGGGYQGPVMVMQGYGGLLPAEEAAERAIGMLECGPAAGVIGSRALGQLLDQPDVIATDMGGRPSRFRSSRTTPSNTPRSRWWTGSITRSPRSRWSLLARAAVPSFHWSRALRLHGSDQGRPDRGLGPSATAWGRGADVDGRVHADRLHGSRNLLGRQHET